VTLSAGEATNVSELAITNFEMDAPVLLLSAAETMLQELEKPPGECNLLTDLFSKLSRVSDTNRNCSVVSCDTDCKKIDDIYESDIKKQKPGHNHLCRSLERIRKLKENSRKMVSMFIPPDAPKLSFLNDAVGMYH